MNHPLIKKPGVRFRHACGENFLVDIQYGKKDSIRTIHINEVTAFLWESIADNEEFTLETLTQLLIKEYEVDEELARNDMTTLINGLVDAGVIIRK